MKRLLSLLLLVPLAALAVRGADQPPDDRKHSHLTQKVAELAVQIKAVLERNKAELKVEIRSVNSRADQSSATSTSCHRGFGPIRVIGRTGRAGVGASVATDNGVTVGVIGRSPPGRVPTGAGRGPGRPGWAGGRTSSQPCRS